MDFGAAFNELTALAAEVRSAGSDHEAAHVEEDALVRRALTIIAQDSGQFGGAVARLTLQLLEEFEGDTRWYS